MEQVCVGLAYAHRHGIVHRDVKPANLMISRDSGVLKVLDFGVAGRVDADPGARGPDAHGDAELHVARSRSSGQPSDHRSDIFSVGLVLYELLTYRQAFSGESQQSILLKVLNESPLPLASLDPAASTRRCRPSSTARSRSRPTAATRISRRCARTCRGSASGVLAAETSHDLVGRGTVAARGRGPRRPRRRSAGRTPSPPAPTAAAEPGPAPAPTPAPARARPTRRGARRHRALAAAERDAYEGRFAAAIRRLEAARPAPGRRRRAAPLPRTPVAARDAASAQGAAPRHHRRRSAPTSAASGPRSRPAAGARRRSCCGRWSATCRRPTTRRSRQPLGDGRDTGRRANDGRRPTACADPGAAGDAPRR